LDRFSLSRDGFLRSGETTECLKAEGKVPDDKDKLTILVMVGRRAGRQALRSQVGIGSRSHCLLGEFMMAVWTSFSVAGEKMEKSGGADGGCM
jgi:hypothetical protein